ncbi:MAG: aldo/keto reductase [Chloroflexota bacterium]
MHTRTLGRTGLQVSEIGLGALEIGRDWGIRIEGDFGRPAEQEAIALVHAALDRGINLIDTAPAYQLSEERLGKALQGRRESVVLATKAGEHYTDERGFWLDYTADAIRTSIEQSLRRLQTDVIDLMQIHSASVEVIQHGEVMEVMKEFQQAGHIRFIGMSGGHDAAVAAITDGNYDTVQVVYNIFEQGARDTVFPAAREHNVGVIVMVPLGHGAMTSKYEHLDAEGRARVEQIQFLERDDQTLAQAALRFVLEPNAVSTTIPGTRKVENLRANVEAADSWLREEEMTRLLALHR